MYTLYSHLWAFLEIFSISTPCKWTFETVYNVEIYSFRFTSLQYFTLFYFTLDENSPHNETLNESDSLSGLTKAVGSLP